MYILRNGINFSNKTFYFACAVQQRVFHPCLAIINGFKTRSSTLSNLIIICITPVYQAVYLALKYCPIFSGFVQCFRRIIEATVLLSVAFKASSVSYFSNRYCTFAWRHMTVDVSPS